MFPFVSVFLIADRHGVREVVGHEHAQDRVGSVGGLCPEHSAPQKDADQQDRTYRISGLRISRS
jgi:hypothetical protein